MKRLVMAVLALSALTPVSAYAQETRMSDARYISAQRCLAYADLPQLQSDPLDFSALRQAVEPGYRSSSVTADARNTASRVRATASSLANEANGLDELRERRDEACASFVERGLVQAGTSPTGGR
jgi:hypothetical protein